MQSLKVKIVQTNLIWEDKEANIQNFNNLLESSSEEAHLIVLPEMFNTGFSMNPENTYELEQGPTFDWMQTLAKKTGSAVVGSFTVKTATGYVNRAHVVFPDGRYDFYDKRHLFRMGGETNNFTPGNRNMIFEWAGWKFKLMICYDLRFPVWAKNNYNSGYYEYDALINIANWPAVRSEVWKTLLKARAIENQCYAIGVNRIGQDGNGLQHSGNTNIIDPKGNPMLGDTSNLEFVKTMALSLEELNNFREKFTVGLDWDDFEIKL